MNSDIHDGHPSPADPVPAKVKSKRKDAATDDLGRALRSAYDEALREDVPDDFLDLLGKLN